MSPDSVLPWLATNGASFVLLRARNKRPCHRGWAESPVSLAVAERHVADGGNVGILVGRPSQGIVCLDADLDFALIHQLLPVLGGVRIVRNNASQRGKFLLRLPRPTRNRSWRPQGSRRPGLELLADRKVAVVPPSIHPSGVPYVMQGERIPVLATRVVESVWEVLTAASLETLPFPIRGEWDAPLTRWPGSQCNEALTEVKRRWPSALAVFRHYGWTGDLRRAGPHDLRLLGHGGLLMGRPDGPYAWRWYCFCDETGGDQIDAAGYCIFGTRWDRRDRAMMRAVLNTLRV